MARRPQKPSREKRQKWAVLNPTPSEREAIEAKAADAGTGLSAFIISTVLSRSNRLEGNFALTAHQQAILINLLTEVADQIADRDDDPMQIMMVLAALLRIEQVIGVMLAKNGKDASC